MKFVILGALTLAPFNGFFVFLSTLLLNKVLLHHQLVLSQYCLLGIITGLGGSVSLAVLNRPLVHSQGKHSPHGLLATSIYVLIPPTMGAVGGLWVAGSSFVGWGALCGFLGFLPQLYFVEPWKNTSPSPEELEERSRAVKNITKQTVAEIEDHKEELRRKHRRRVTRKEKKRQQKYRLENRPQTDIQIFKE